MCPLVPCFGQGWVIWLFGKFGMGESVYLAPCLLGALNAPPTMVDMVKQKETMP